MRGKSDESSTALLATAKAGCPEAFARLVQMHRGYIAKIARKAARGPLLRVMELTDVIQEILTSVFLSIASAEFSSLSAFRGWLARVVHNRVIDLRRTHLGARRWPGATDPLPEPPSQDGTGSRGGMLAASASSPSTAMMRKEQAARLDQVLARLPAEHQDVIRWIVVERLPTGEIAARLGRTPESVRQVLHRALLACRVAIVEDAKETGRPLRRSKP